MKSQLTGLIKKTVFIPSVISFTLSSALPITSFATLTPDLAGRGAEKIEHNNKELCYIPNRLEGSKFSKKDLQREAELCQMSTSDTHAVCGKVESTNPALEFFEIPQGWTVQQVESMNCFYQNPKAKKDLKTGRLIEDNLFKKKAKYKLSTSCSYTPSLLSYYQISRILGNINQVPSVVLRTVDAETHRLVGTKTYSNLKNKESLIAQTWSSLLSMLNKKQAHPRATNIFTDNYQQTFGALQFNPTSEEKYSEMFHGGHDQQTRAQNFKNKNPSFQRLRQATPLKSMGLSSWNENNVQEVLKMQNIADMILLDTLLNQQDRFGNIHYTMEPYALVQEGEKIKVDKLDTLSKKELASGANYPHGTVFVKKMMMKDNDCGVVKENVLKNAGLFSELKHFNPETFVRLLKFHKTLQTEDGAQFFKNETAMTSNDVNSLRSNLNYIINDLVQKCRKGQLLLDLDLDIQFAGQKEPSCLALIDRNL